MQFVVGATSQSGDILIVDDTGIPVTGLVASTFPAVYWSLAGANASVAFPELSDLATITTAWVAGGVKERSLGRYRLDFPNTMLASVGSVNIFGEETDKRIIAPEITIISPAQYTIAPIVGRVTATGMVADADTIVAYHYAPVVAGPFVVLDANDDPIDLTAYSGSLAFIVYSIDETGVETINARLTGSNVIVGGTDDNEVALAGTTTLTTLVGRFRWAIRITTAGDKRVLMQGDFLVKPCGNTA